MLSTKKSEGHLDTLYSVFLNILNSLNIEQLRSVKTGPDLHKSIT